VVGLPLSCLLTFKNIELTFRLLSEEGKITGHPPENTRMPVFVCVCVCVNHSISHGNYFWPNISKYGAVCWDPYRECQIRALDRVQNKATKFTHCLGRTEWESLAQRRNTACMCALYKAYNGDRACKEIRDRLHAPSYLSKVDHNWKIRARKQRTDTGKYSFVNRSIADWNQLPTGVIGTVHGNTHKFKTRVRKMLTGEGKYRC